MFDRQVVGDPGWMTVELEFVLAAVHDPEIRGRLSTRWEDLLARKADMIDQLFARAGRTSSFTGAELVVLMSALATGFALRQLLQPESLDTALLIRAVRRLGLDAPYTAASSGAEQATTYRAEMAREPMRSASADRREEAAGGPNHDPDRHP
jgi:hypothetical protein